tara:strand:- start:36098 stop:37021 length:924 start_codon:yes stop_codon:yes gene_type:complete
MIDYIENLSSNYKKEKTKEIDIIIEGGALNGYYAYGVLKLVDKLEEIEYFKVDRISGVSIGALLGYLYLTNNLNVFNEMYGKLKKYYVLNNNLKMFIDYLTEIIDELPDEKFKEIKENKLYITFFNANEKKQIIKSNYENKEDLKKSLLKSMHIPYLLNGEDYYKENEVCYMDGLYPYLFKDRINDKKILYLKLINMFSFSDFKNTISSKKEINMEKRIMEGSLDAHNFFLFNKKSKICSYLNNWSRNDFIYFRIKEMLIILIIFIINIITSLIKLINPFLREFDFFNKFMYIGENLYNDIMIYYNS